MYPFVSVLWDALDSDAARVARQLLTTVRAALPDYDLALDANGGVVLHAPASGGALRAYNLPKRAGLILGRLFPIAADEWTSTWSWCPTESETTEILRSRGKWLMQRMWGAYIAFLFDLPGANAFVVRDCSGRIPCYRLRVSQVDLLFADPGILSILGMVPTSLNWNYIRSFLCSSHLQTRDTALTGVTELLAGDCFQRMPAGRSKHYCAWTPMEALQSPRILRFDSAVQNVRSVVMYCIKAWASVYGTILHNLSGGLDSSIVLACLMKFRDPSTVICVNRYGPNAIEDERAFARLAAAKTGVQLLEVPLVSDDRRIDDHTTNVALTAKPTIQATFGNRETPFITDFCRRLNVSSIWTGQGGDHLFIQTSLPLGAADFAALNGIGPRLLRPLHDSVRLSKWNYWSALSLLWSKHADLPTRATHSDPITKHPFITPDVRSRVHPDDLLHPWTLDAKSLPPGQDFQITSLSDVLNRHRPLPGIEAVNQHHPLLSQPLIELCLRIPSYLHLYGGIDRAVERAAFTDLIPSQIATRRQKGQATLSVLELIHRSRGYLLGLTLDGVLVKEGIIDRAALAPFLSGHRPTDTTSLLPLLSCIAAEVWVRTWHNSMLNSERARHTPPVYIR